MTFIPHTWNGAGQQRGGHRQASVARVRKFNAEPSPLPKTDWAEHEKIKREMKERLGIK